MLMAAIFSLLSAVLALAAMLGGEAPQPLDPLRRES